jgi:hypothetical protein
MPACLVRVMPVSARSTPGARDVARGGALDIQTRRQVAGIDGPDGGVSSFFNGSFSAQSPQNLEPPAFRSDLSVAMVGPVQTPCSDVVRASPSTRWP